MGTSASPAGRHEASESDQRQSPRRIVSEPIAVELQPGREGWIRDLGEGGFSVSGSSPFALGTSAAIRFELPEADSVIDASGVVTWSDESGRAGVRFTRVEPDSTAALRRWLNAGASGQTSQSDAPRYDHDLANKVACLREVADLQAIISSEHLETSAALDLIARRMAELTRATGAAIALREGEDVFCRASFGNAPDVGVKLSSSSLSGECLRSGATVMLEDSETDPRVNSEVCRQLNFRTLLVVPVPSGNEIVGIAEVLSPELRNFESGDVLVMSFLADLIANLAAPSKEAPAAAYSELMLQALEPLERVDSQSRVEETAPAESRSVKLAVIESRQVPLRQEKQAVPADEKFQHLQKAAPVRISIPTLGVSVLGIILGIALLLLGYAYYRQGRASAKPSTALQSAPLSINSTALPSLPTSMSTTGGSPNPGTEGKASRIARPAASSVVVRAKEPAVTELAVIQGHTVSVKPAPEPAAPEAVAISALDPGRPSSSLAASIVATKTAAPELLPSQSQGVVPGKLIKRVLPQYPDMARRAGVSGDVVISGIIRTDGVLRNLKVLSGSPLLREAALDAARQWRYSPYLLGGKPVEAETHITVSFHQ